VQREAAAEVRREPAAKVRREPAAEVHLNGAGTVQGQIWQYYLSLQF
jgi:hypothetical protein